MKRLIKTGLLALCLTMFMTAQTFAAGTSFSTEGRKDGNKVEIAVTILDGTAYSGEIVIEYDSEVLEFVSAEESATASSTLIFAASENDSKITIGFADYAKAVQGEIVKLIFNVLVTEPMEGYSVNVDIAEWSGDEEINSEVDELAYVNYDVVMKNGETTIVNMDTNGDGTPDVSVDTDGDGVADINIDTTGDGKADINIDTDGDGVADTDIDTDGDGEADKNLSDTGTGEGNNGNAGEGNNGNAGSGSNGSGNTETGNNGTGSTGSGDNSSEDEGTAGEEGDSSEDEGTTGDEGESGDEGENEGSGDDSTSKPDKDTQTNTDTNEEEKKPVVWPFIVGGIVVIGAVVGFFFFKKKSA